MPPAAGGVAGADATGAWEGMGAAEAASALKGAGAEGIQSCAAGLDGADRTAGLVKSSESISASISSILPGSPGRTGAAGVGGGGRREAGSSAPGFPPGFAAALPPAGLATGVLTGGSPFLLNSEKAKLICVCYVHVGTCPALGPSPGCGPSFIGCRDMLSGPADRSCQPACTAGTRRRWASPFFTVCLLRASGCVLWITC